MREKSIELLNKAIADELSAVHQYMYFHFHCDDQGYDLLSNLSNVCSQNADSASRKIFEALVDDEERHYGQYDKEMENLVKFGDNYLALQSIEHSKNVGAGRPTK